MPMYEYSGITQKPNQGYCVKKIASDITVALDDISYHPEQQWLRLWFPDDLTAEQKITLDNIVNASVGLSDEKTWRHVENEEGNYVFQKYVDGTGWVNKFILGSEVATVQPPEIGSDPVIFAPNNAVLKFSDPSTAQNISGVSVADADSPILTIQITSTNGSLDFPLTSGMTPVEISGGIEFTGSAEQISIETGGMTFTPTNAGSPAGPQNGTINILLNDQDPGTENATHEITIEVLADGRE